MSLGEKMRSLLGGAPRIKVRVFVSGRVGLGWRDADRTFHLPEGACLKDLIKKADDAGLDLTGAFQSSPHLRFTAMLNGERCPIDENQDRPLQDGDEFNLLAPLAGG